MVWQLAKHKLTTSSLARGFFAELQSVAISQGSIRVLHLAVFFPATAAIKKRPHDVRELMVHTTD